jgi:hypothetical protein
MDGEEAMQRRGFLGCLTAYLSESWPPKAVLGVAYELATGQRLVSGDFEGGKTRAVRVLGKLGFSIEKKLPTARSS